MFVQFALYKNEKILCVAEHWEDLDNLVEELKKLNQDEIDRRDFAIMSGDEIIKAWNRK